jgi:hypothetical protein
LHGAQRGYSGQEKDDIHHFALSRAEMMNVPFPGRLAAGRLQAGRADAAGGQALVGAQAVALLYEGVRVKAISAIREGALLITDQAVSS